VHPYLDVPGPIAFAHRGGAGVHPENTMPAFAHAVALGYRYLETDVHATRDGVLLAFHDEDLARTCGVDVRIGDITLAESRQIKVHDAAHIPTLDELLETWPDVRLNIDCKADSAIEPLAASLRHAQVRQRVCIGSFSDRRLRHFRDLYGDDLCTSMGPREVGQTRLASYVPRTPFSTGAHAAQVPLRQGPIPLVDRRFVDFCHERGLHVHVWTIDDAATMHDLLDLGVDGIMTDQPETLKQVMIERGVW
jgi:glycerophosphoryl diester phosphodiesterase